MLKQDMVVIHQTIICQPPSGGCVLKHTESQTRRREPTQPPSGGCVLKPIRNPNNPQITYPAAFGRLCVETFTLKSWLVSSIPAAFGRLCVETRSCLDGLTWSSPAAFGRLCVETFLYRLSLPTSFPAAFGRLCVETSVICEAFLWVGPSRLRAAVC